MQQHRPIIQLPRQFDGQSLSKVAADLMKISPHGLPPEIEFDFSNLGFARPAGVVFLSNLVQWLQQKGTQVHFTNIAKETASLRFLDDSLFFEQHCGQKVRATASPRSTTQPLMRIAHKDSHAWLQTNLVPWLAERISITEASLYPFKVCISELFNNIKDHTVFDIGSIFAQHFPNERQVMISISDFGQGIPEKVREKVLGLSDSQAIVQAVQEGFTSKSTPGNQGVGLDYLLKTVVVANQGIVTICSSNAIVRFWRKGTNAGSIVLSNVGFCPGTTIDIVLRTDRIAILPDEPEDLQW